MNSGNRKITTLFAVPQEPRSRTSDVILTLVEQAERPGVTLRILTKRLGDRIFGMLLVLFAVFTVLPIVSFVSGLLIAVLGVQMALGKRQAWLPRVILDLELPSNKVKAALLRFEPKVRMFEKYVRPRWQQTEAPIVDCINGFVITILGIIITIPIPFTNIPPAIMIIIMGLGLMERDGLIQVIAAIFGLFVAGGISYMLIA